MKKMLYSFALLLACGFAYAHSGGTDAYGCHTNRKTGDYRGTPPRSPQTNASLQFSK
jgi:hypothetical protein